MKMHQKRFINVNIYIVLTILKCMFVKLSFGGKVYHLFQLLSDFFKKNVNHCVQTNKL